MNEPLNIPIQVPQGDATLALLERIAAALEDTGKKSEEASQKTASGWGRAEAGLNAAADSFNEARQAVTSLFSDVAALAEGMAAAADEAAALAGRSRELGVDFDEAAESAGRFLDETSAMGAANQFAARGINLTQQELNALTRVAGATSQALRITTEEGVTRLTDALISGRGRALAPFGAELSAVAGNTHTAEERLRALVSQADRVAPAVDSATDSIKRFQDNIEDMQREFATGFVEGIREMDRLRVSTHDANDEATDLNVTIRAIGSTAAEVVTLVGNGVGVVLGAIGMAAGGALAAVTAVGAAQQAVMDGNISGAGAAASAAFERSMTQGLANDSFRFLQDRISTLEAIAGAGDARSSMAAPSVAAATPGRGTARGTRGALGGNAGGNDNERPGGVAIGGMAGAVLDRMAEEARQRQEREETAANARRLAAVRAQEERANVDRLIAQEAARERHQRGSTLGDRLDAQREQRNLTRAQRNIQQRLDMELSFNDRMQDIHNSRISATQEVVSFTEVAYGSLATSLAAHFQTIEDGSETVGHALQAVLSEVLLSLSKEAFVKSAFYIAEGLAHLVMWDLPGAGTAFAAATAYGVAGAAAGAAGREVAPPPLQKPSGASAPTSGSRPAASVSKGSGDGDGGPTVVNVMFGGPQYGTGGTRQAAREIAGVLNRGAVQGGVRLNLRAVGGAF